MPASCVVLNAAADPADPAADPFSEIIIIGQVQL